MRIISYYNILLFYQYFHMTKICHINHDILYLHQQTTNHRRQARRAMAGFNDKYNNKQTNTQQQWQRISA